MNTISICYPHPSQYHGGTVFFPAILALTWIPSGKFFFLNTVFSQQFSDKSLSNPLTCFSFRTPSTVLASAPCFQNFLHLPALLWVGSGLSAPLLNISPPNSNFDDQCTSYRNYVCLPASASPSSICFWQEQGYLTTSGAFCRDLFTY